MCILLSRSVLKHGVTNKATVTRSQHRSYAQAILEDLHSSRQAQQAAKLTQQAEMAQHEKSEFERIIRVNRAKEEHEAGLAEKV